MNKSDLRKMINMRPKARRNYDPNPKNLFSESTVIMESGEGEQDGVPIYYAYPTLFPNDPTSKSTTSNPDDWTEFEDTDEGHNKAFSLARERGEIFVFRTKKEADDFAKGSWKEPVEIMKMDDAFKKMQTAAE